MPLVRILIADSHSAFLRSVAGWLDVVSAMEMVGQTCSGSAALELAQQLRPELVLVGWRLVDMRGTDVTRRLKTLPSPPQVVIMALDDLPAYRAAAVASGADGFIAKAELATRLLPLILAMFAERAADATGADNSP